MKNILSYAENYLLESLVIALVLGALLGVVIAWMIWRRSDAIKQQMADQKFLSAQQLHEQNLLQIQTDKEQLDEQVVRQDRELLHLNKLTVKLAEQLKQQQLIAQQVEEKETALHQSERRLTQLQSELEHQQQRFKEQRDFIQNSQKALSDHFASLGQKILEEKSKQLGETNQEKMQQVVNPLNKQLKEFQSLVQNTSTQGLAQQQSLKMEIERIYQLNQTLSQKAEDLTNALTAQSKVQGNWGELVLTRLLEVAGMEQGREFDTEVSFNMDNKRVRPDVLIHLPHDRRLVVDAKVSLTAYKRYINAEDETDRSEQLKGHISSIRQHVKGLSEREYHRIDGINTLDFVLMFVPVESAFIDAIRHQPQLIEEAYRKNVLILSASNLLATLRTVMMLWQNENQNKNAQLIADKAGKMYDKFVGFVEDLNLIKQRLNQADNAWHKAENKLTSGQGNLVRQAENLKTLGAKNSKELKNLE